MSNPEFSTGEISNASERAKHFKVIVTNFPATDFPIGINLLDIWNNCNPRIRAYIDNVAPADSNYDKFIARINPDTWGDTRLYGARCTWFDISKHSLDFQFGRFNTGNMSGTNDDKAKSIDIQFTCLYQTPPKVVVWLTGLDSDCTRNMRLDTSAENITSDGFELTVNTWGDSIIYNATVSWISISSGNPLMTAGRLVTPYTGPSSGFQQKIIFDKPFKRVPHVMAALNKLDISNGANLRIAAYPKDITPQGMTLAIDTWYDSVIYSCGAGYIAIDDAPASSKSVRNLVRRKTTNNDTWGVSRELKALDTLKMVEGVLEATFDSNIYA
ncbi:hypothetical protein OPQ81_000801 [Rhizoctonia solani]|nr:hypothetical protein OPQ81_000801 [Rhizoctonia solani]